MIFDFGVGGDLTSIVHTVPTSPPPGPPLPDTVTLTITSDGTVTINEGSNT